MEAIFRLLDNTADGAFAIDENQRICYWNQAAQAILGYSPEEVMGQPCYKILRGCDDKGSVICHQRCDVSVNALAGRMVVNYNVATRSKSGEMRWINVSILTLANISAQGSSLVVHLFRDATQAKQNEQFIHQMFDTVEKWHKVASLPPSPNSTRPLVEALTQREEEVLILLTQGLSTSQIARSLSISSATVRNHIQNILHKLNVHSRIEAVAYAFERGLVARE